MSESFLRAARAGDTRKVLDFINSGVSINATNPTGLTALHLAAKEGYITVVKELIQNGADVNASSKKGNTALHIASLAGHFDIVKALLDANADSNCQSTAGFTPLYMAAQENHLDVVNLLLNRGANQSLTTEDGFTPLAVALQQGHDRVVAILLERDTRSRGTSGLPALHVAARKDDVSAVNLLLANPDVNVNHQSQPGFTALHISAHYGSAGVGAILIQRGADVNFQAKNNITPLHVAAKWGRVHMVKLLLANKALVDSRTRDGLTPLHCAARSGHNGVCSMLMEAGCNPTAKTRNGLTPLHMAAQGNHDDVARTLISRGAGLCATTGDFLNPLHVAAHCGNEKVARVLLEKGCDMNARALNGFTPLHIACKKNRLPVVELLLKHGAQIVSTTEAGLTPLHVAALIGSPELAGLLLKRGASVSLVTMRGETPLHLGVRSGNLEIVELLLSHGAAVDAKAKDEQTPLHIATLRGYSEMVLLLLKFGANPNFTTRDAYGPLHIAAKEGHSEIVQCLLANGADPVARTRRGFCPLHLASKGGRVETARTLLQVLRAEDVNAAGRNGLTPLHMATHYNHLPVVELLLQHGAEADRVADNGYTTLHIAAKRNHGDLACFLLEKDRDPKQSTNAESRCGFTPLHLAAQEGNANMVRLLLLKGADAGHKAKNGITPMHLAALEDQVDVLKQLVQAGAPVNTATLAGYTPLHTASYAGRLNASRYLIGLPSSSSNVNATTDAGFTPLHLAAQQGHSQIVYLLLEHGAEPNAINAQGLTAAHIARRQHFLAIFDTLRTVTTVITNWEEIEEIDEIVLDSPEMTQIGVADAVESDDDDDGDENTNPLIPMPSRKSDPSSYLSQYQTEYIIKDSSHASNGVYAVDSSCEGDLTWNEIDYLRQPLDEHTPQESSAHKAQHNTSLSATLTSDFHMDETTSKALGDPGDHIDAEWAMETESSSAFGVPKKPLTGGFLVSFVVDARGGLLESKRYPGLRFLIPPNAAVGPLRIICRFLRHPFYLAQPPLNDAEGLACRLLEMGPVGVRFNAPILIEIPYFASLRNKQREIVVLRSENGDIWKEHPVEPTDQAVQDSLGEYLADAIPSSDLGQRQIHRILTNTIPQYFALITRTRQDLVLVGPEGCVMTSSLNPQVQVAYPPGALQKKIRVGLQVHTVEAGLVTACLGSPRIAVSPIVTIEPRRRKFHRPITVSIPLPSRGGGGGGSDGGQGKSHLDLSTIRLLCSITGGASPAVWEDITGGSPLSLQKNAISFTTTVSARLWLIDCPNINEVSEIATRVYREVVAIPYLGQFVVYGRRHHLEEVQLRCICHTADNTTTGTEPKTLEGQEGFEMVAQRSPIFEFLHDRPVWIETAGNLVPVAATKTSSSSEVGQIGFPCVRAFDENRLNMLVRIKDPSAPPTGQLAFMPQQKQSGGLSIDPLAIVDLLLPQKVTTYPSKGVQSSTNPSYVNGIPMQDDNAKDEMIEHVTRQELNLGMIASRLDADWLRAASPLGLSDAEVIGIQETDTNDYTRALMCLNLWREHNGVEATGTALSQALKQAGLDWGDNTELSHTPPRGLSCEKARDEGLATQQSSLLVENDYFPEEAEKAVCGFEFERDDESVLESEISAPTEVQVEPLRHTTNEERRATLEGFADLLESAGDMKSDSTASESAHDQGVREEEVVPETRKPSQREVEESLSESPSLTSGSQCHVESAASPAETHH